MPRDCLVDRLAEGWETVHERFAHLPPLVLHLDNGPAHHRRRPQCMPRLGPVVPQSPLTVRLAYSPPYHRQDNPIERWGGILANHGHGTLLDAIDPVLQCARTMTWSGTLPVVALVTATYQTGVTLTKDAMETVAAPLQRLPVLGKWVVDIVAPPLALRDT